jgi:hypothetical protein
MNVLYLGKYRRRFRPIEKMLTDVPEGRKVLELCFGDIEIATFCRRKNLDWKGFDINPHFVDYASSLGFNASHVDLTQASLPQADVCIMAGSLYHFHSNVAKILTKMLEAAPVIIISEPVLNLSSMPGILGFLARKSANVGKGDEIFRFNHHSLMEEVQTFCNRSSAHITAQIDAGKDLVIKIERNVTA